jgi:hypothetical protein
MTKLPTGVRIKGNRLQMRLKRPGRGWEWEATGLDAEQLETAAKLRATTQAIIDSGTTPAAFGRLTVRSWAKRWISGRRDRGLRSVDDDERRLRLHVLGHVFESGRELGDMFMDEVRPMHARAVIRALLKKGMAPRTIINTHSVASGLFDDAVADELLERMVWVVPRKEMPKKRDANPEWREGALFTLEEMRTLLWAPDDKVPRDRRVFYALCYFGRLRFGEASARRWRDRLETQPLRALHVHSSFATKRSAEDETKTKGARRMPEHPTLSAILAEWKADGWREHFGRDPKGDDLIVPAARGGFRRSNHMRDDFEDDLARLGLRHRRQHDLGRSFISHAVDAGALRERLRPGTHGLGTSVIELYDTPLWKACCDEVVKLKLDPPSAEVAAIAMGTPWGGDHGKGSLMHYTRSGEVEAPGIEVCASIGAGQRATAKEQGISTTAGASPGLKSAEKRVAVPILPTARKRFAFAPARRCVRPARFAFGGAR